MNIAELQVQGTAQLTAIDVCPEIADGEGSVVTARFITREVHVIARVKILGPNGQIETLEGTTIHPIWSEDLQDWVPLGELIEGETLRSADGPATVLSITIASVALPVYNIEVHGEHVYQVGELAVVVHNSTPCTTNFAAHLGPDFVIAGKAINRTIEETVESVASIKQSIKGTMSATKADAEKLAR